MSAIRVARISVVILFVALVITCAILLFGTDQGWQVLREPRVVGERFRLFLNEYPVLGPLLFVIIYGALGLLMLPLWWMQFLAGVGFGIAAGLAWVQLSAMLAAAAGMHLSRWVAGEWFRERIESRMPRVRALEEKLGHNGFLVVVVARLVRGLPFGLANYAFGIMRITTADVVAGTLLGGLPAAAFYVVLGANPAVLTDWRFAPLVVVMFALLVVPLILRYWRPAWFRRIGIE